MRYLSIAAMLIASSECRVDPTIACKAMCGLDHRVSARDCEMAIADGSICRHVYREASGDILFSQTTRVDIEQISVAIAIAETQATDNNCFAMCFENLLCRNQGSYCNESGVCAALFWNKQKRQAVDSYAFHIGGAGDASNQDAPVTCDSALPEELPGRVNPSRIDPCIATCHLSGSSPDTCRWVQEANGQCSRLFWASPEKTGVEFSPRAARSPQTQIQATELVELLKAPNNDCAALCDSIPTCRSDARGSFCRDNGACQGLFYQNGTRPVKAELIPCYGPGCNELTPVMCDYDAGPSAAPTASAAPLNGTRRSHIQPTVAVPSSPSPSIVPNAANAIEGGVSTSSAAPVAADPKANERISQPTTAMIVFAVIAVAFF